MSVRITIGEIEEILDDDGPFELIKVIKVQKSDEAPIFVGENPDYEQLNTKSSICWPEFCQEGLIYGLFYNRHTGLFKTTGVYNLTTEHLNLVSIKRVMREERIKKPPGFGSDIYDPVLARLIWLEYWIEWALEKCQNPGIENV